MSYRRGRPRIKKITKKELKQKIKWFGEDYGERVAKEFPTKICFWVESTEAREGPAYAKSLYKHYKKEMKKMGKIPKKCPGM